ncbi:DUF305 domain-containing protein [Hymenobacter terricola]|uniref:DUF305 domain-containing protein n=1 Tax=Hymenobacter terricola TaxID=2819236 RepID=UPI001B3093C9|nr:DUF305 domain-containing protein [Hymenobacter terricola]
MSISTTVHRHGSLTARTVAGGVLVLALLAGGCHGSADETNGTGVHELPPTMMAALHTMVERSQSLPPADNLDLYFALLLRENHRAAVAMSALELNKGQDPALRAAAEHINHDHQQLIVSLESANRRLRALPPSFPEHTTQSERFSRLLDAATSGLHPAAHRTIARLEAGADSLRVRSNQHQEDAGTGSIDRDFAALLIAHHQNSITLARAELELGRDEQLQQVAYLVLQDQQREIEQLQQWLIQHPDKAR